MPRVPRTKIVATLGPSSCTYGVILRMVRAGLDVVRLNFSHGSWPQHLEVLETVRLINSRYRRRIRVMQDLAGFRMRVGRFNNGGVKQLKAHSVVSLKQGQDDGRPATIPFDYTGDLSTVAPGQWIYIDDGALVLRVKAVTAGGLRAGVVEGGELKERKGINMPGVRLDFPDMTEKDAADVEFAIEHRLAYVALSFVRTARDVTRMRDLVQPRHPGCKLIAKIESREAIRNTDAIIAAADGIMIARGDMGIAVPIYRVPFIQKDIIRRCNRLGKPVITATQMLESMTTRKSPTRAEVTDVANAILDGSDYVMLSGETAAGRYPVECVRMMNSIIKYAEEARGAIEEAQA